jgi:hypothetical protein
LPRDTAHALAADINQAAIARNPSATLLRISPPPP